MSGNVSHAAKTDRETRSSATKQEKYRDRRARKHQHVHVCMYVLMYLRSDGNNYTCMYMYTECGGRAGYVAPTSGVSVRLGGASVLFLLRFDPGRSEHTIIIPSLREWIILRKAT